MMDYSKLPKHPLSDIPQADKDMPEQEADYEWAEYNLPLALLLGIAPTIEEEDRLAFLCFGLDSDIEVSDGSS